VVGPGNGPWLFLHKASFILWFGVMTIHVLNYAPRLPRLLLAHTRHGNDAAGVAGASARWLALVISLAAGAGVAAMTLQLSEKWNFGF